MEEDKNQVDPITSSAYEQVLDNCEAAIARFTKALSPVLDERREFLKHLITLSSSILVISVSLAALVWNTKRPIVDPDHLMREWCGLGMCLLCSLISANALSGARAMLLHVLNDRAAINQALNKQGAKANIEEIVIQTTNKALAQVAKDEKISRIALKLGFMFFGYSILDLMAFGVRQFSGW